MLAQRRRVGTLSGGEKVNTAVLAWGSLLWDPRDLQTRRRICGEWPAAADRVLPGFGRRTTDARDRRDLWLCLLDYSAPCALDALDAAIENLRLREGMPNTRAVGFVETASGRQSDVAIERHPDAVATIAAWASRTDTTPQSGPRSRATSMSPARAASRSRSPRRSGILERWKVGTGPSSRAPSPISGRRRPKSRRRCARKSRSAGPSDHALAAVRLAVANELRRLEDETPLRERIAAIRRSIVARGRGQARQTTSSARPDNPRRFDDHCDSRSKKGGGLTREGRSYDTEEFSPACAKGGSFTAHATWSP